MNTKPSLRPLAILAIAATSACLTSGCHVATSTQPIGTRSLDLSELPLEGVWHSPDGQPFYLRTVDANAGQLEVANVTTNQQGFILQRHEVLLRQQENATFANIRSIDPNPDEHYTFGRLTIQENLLILTLAPAGHVRRLALEGAVQAAITTNQQGDGVEYSVIVTNGFEHLGSRLASPDGWRWLDTGNPIVLSRQKSGLN